MFGGMIVNAAEMWFRLNSHELWVTRR